MFKFLRNRKVKSNRSNLEILAKRLEGEGRFDAKRCIWNPDGHFEQNIHAAAEKYREEVVSKCDKCGH